MSLSEYITASYGASIYRKTLKLKETKKTMAKSKNQTIFLGKCLFHNILPKSFVIQSPLRSNNASRIITKCRTDLLMCAKNGARSRYFRSSQKAIAVKTEL